jgi:hypothetical protein
MFTTLNYTPSRFHIIVHSDRRTHVRMYETCKLGDYWRALGVAFARVFLSFNANSKKKKRYDFMRAWHEMDAHKDGHIRLSVRMIQLEKSGTVSFVSLIRHVDKSQ